ncbi:MAG: hydrogenase expression/formation protein HypE [Chlorobi bacterium]|nr:hydrogenase expression/formation protein HypE [Chlorobiota bacterium]
MKKEDIVLLNHGSGGKMAHELIRNLFFRHFDNEVLTSETDSAILDVGDGQLAFTTDSYVVNPLFFPGGNIGKLAVCGTVNDLSVSGAKPEALSVSFILEEGFLLSDLEKIVISMAETAREAGVAVVTGDTKVVEHGKCDKIFINTSGVGWLSREKKKISYGTGVAPGDIIMLNGTLGDHGITVLAARESLEMSPDLQSDCAPLNGLIQHVFETGAAVKFMRDPTRGGLATVLCELAETLQNGIELEEENIPVSPVVRGACEVFGYDPLYLANEGKVVMVVAEKDADSVLTALREHPLGQEAVMIGQITENHPGKVVLRTEIGGNRIVDMLAGEQLPRIC